MSDYPTPCVYEMLNVVKNRSEMIGTGEKSLYCQGKQIISNVRIRTIHRFAERQFPEGGGIYTLRTEVPYM